VALRNALHPQQPLARRQQARRAGAARAQAADLAEEVARPKAILALFRRAIFRRPGDQFHPTPLALTLAEAIRELAEDGVKVEAAAPPLNEQRADRQGANRG